MSLGVPVETKFFDAGPVVFRSGTSLPNVQLAYETYGQLNEDKSNAILLFHALSGSQHASGQNKAVPGVGEFWQPELHQGWWTDFIGPRKAIDTEKFFVICANYVAGCYGSTGPASLNPETQKPWGSKFPHVTIADQVDIQARLVDSLEIDVLLAVIGPSVGGLAALTFATRHPARVRTIIPIASGFKTTVLNRLILFEQILAIENDPYFCGGDYYGGTQPIYGLALARMISHKTFLHLDTIENRSRQEVVQPEDLLAWFKVRDQVQSYMLHQGTKFTKRFDANTYLRVIDMWAHYDAVAEGDAATPHALLERSRKHGHRYLVFSIDSDFCFYPEEQEELVKNLERAEVETIHITVHSHKGHDSFLLEPQLFAPHVSYALNQA